MPGAVKLSYRVKDALDASDEDEDGARPVQSLYFAAFKELTQAFEELAKKTVKHIVVFVDDLDRCFPASALEMLEAMKLFFDLPGFVFVVGLDENVVKRAVDAKFAATGFAERTPETVVDGPSPEEYIKKIFQLPFALPPMTTQQLDELLTSIESEAGVEGDQLADLKGRVRNYLRFVAVDGRVNPREVKRYINAYTLQVLIRPSLDRDTMLALQSLAFRGDWQDAYELVLAYPEVFVDALRRYRAGESGALEDLGRSCAPCQPHSAHTCVRPRQNPFCTGTRYRSTCTPSRRPGLRGHGSSRHSGRLDSCASLPVRPRRTCTLSAMPPQMRWASRWSRRSAASVGAPHGRQKVTGRGSSPTRPGCVTWRRLWRLRRHRAGSRPPSRTGSCASGSRRPGAGGGVSAPGGLSGRRRGVICALRVRRLARGTYDQWRRISDDTGDLQVGCSKHLSERLGMMAGMKAQARRRRSSPRCPDRLPFLWPPTWPVQRSRRALDPRGERRPLPVCTTLQGGNWVGTRGAEKAPDARQPRSPETGITSGIIQPARDSPRDGRS